MADFSINGVAYQSRVMDGETQTFVLKRLLPTFAALMGCHDALKDAGIPVTGELNVDDPLAGDSNIIGSSLDDGINPYLRAAKRDALMPVARQLAELSDADVRFILDACVDVTKRQAVNSVSWVDVRQRGLIQDQSDKQFKSRLTIAWHVLAENFAEILQSFGVDIADIVKAAAPQA